MPEESHEPAQPNPARAPSAGQSPARPGRSPSVDAADPSCLLQRIPLFPLLNVVLFPGAILPLHIFEQRYRAMTADALGLNASRAPDGRRLICMCRLRPGCDPMDDSPPLFETACIGRIVHHEALPDGRHNFLLQGIRRVRIGREYRPGEGGAKRPYRRADLHPVSCESAFEIDVADARQKMQDLCTRPPIDGTPVGRQLRKLFCSQTPTVQIADVLAFDLLEDPDDRQRLLEEPSERRRVELLCGMLDRQFPEPASIRSYGGSLRDM